MHEKFFIHKCKNLIVDYYSNFTNKCKISNNDVYVVWSHKIQHNNIALLATKLDSLYFEITYNSDKNEFYFDCY